MTDEEKKAINFMRNEIIDFEKRWGTEITTETNRNYEIILNLISKQQKEIEYKDQELLELTNSDKGKLLKENKELKKRNEFLKTLRDSLISTIKDDYIPKTKIEEKIKEIEEYDKKMKPELQIEDNKENFTIESLSIPILKELLESENDND